MITAIVAGVTAALTIATTVTTTVVGANNAKKAQTRAENKARIKSSKDGNWKIMSMMRSLAQQTMGTLMRNKASFMEQRYEKEVKHGTGSYYKVANKEAAEAKQERLDKARFMGKPTVK